MYFFILITTITFSPASLGGILTMAGLSGYLDVGRQSVSDHPPNLAPYYLCHATIFYRGSPGGGQSSCGPITAILPLSS